MRYYVLWGEVQERLCRWREEQRSPTHFPHVLALLWEEGAAHQAESVPAVDFSAWDLSDVEDFRILSDRIPVDISFFLESELGFSGPSEAHRRAMEALPIKIAAHQKKYMHKHENFELLYVLRGGGGVYTESGGASCTEGTLCLLAPEFVHDVYAEPDSVVISLTFQQTSMEAILQKLLRKENIMSEFFRTALDREGQGYVLLHLPPDDRTRYLVRSIFQEGYSREDYARELCADHIELLFTYALRACAKLPGWADGPAGGWRAGVPMAAVLKYLQLNYRTTSLAELAAAFHYEPDYLSRQIKSSLGRSYVELVLELKMNEAKRLLRATSLTVEQIAVQAGFGSGAHLARTFRRREGMMPSQYRKR